MFKTKRDVDRYVTHILNIIRDKKERISRGFQFAKLYYDVAEYETAKRYLQTYLNVHGTSPQAYKLMGQIWEAQKNKKQALEAYQRCLELDPEQKEVVIKVHEPYCDASIEVNAHVANPRIERVERRNYPNNNALFPLKVQKKPRFSPTHIDVQLKAMETANSALLSHISTLEESMHTNKKMIQESCSQLRECRDENRSLRDQLQILSLQGLSGVTIHRPQGVSPPSVRDNTMNMLFERSSKYKLPVLPHMSQYRFPTSVGGPQPGSAFGQDNYDDLYSYENRDYYEPDENECYVPDQNLRQDWPFRPLLIPGSVGIPASVAQSWITTTTPSGTLAQPSGVPSSEPAKHQGDNKDVLPAQPSGQTSQKIQIKGISFISTPNIFETKPDAESKISQPSLTTAVPVSKFFSGISFTKTQPVAISISSQENQASAGVTFTSSLSFGSLAAQGQVATAFQAGGDKKSFPDAGEVMFGKSPSSRQQNTSTCSDEHLEEYEPNIVFKPVIQLPELTEVRTGEEEEAKLFCEKAKLFHFDKETRTWKERGVGKLKILKHNVTKNVRILMRRDQVLKLCANHKLTADMKLTKMSLEDKAWTWNAVDFAEGETKCKQFSARFKNQKIAENFKSVFEKCQAELSQCQRVTGSLAPAQDSSSVFKFNSTKANCFIFGTPTTTGDSLKPGVKSEHIIPMTSAGTQELTSGSPAQLTSVFKFGSLAPAQDSSSVFRFNSTKANCFIFGTPTTTGDSLKPGVKSEHIIPMTSAGTQELTSGSPAQLTSVFKFGSLAPAQDSSSVFKFNSTKANCFIFGTPTTTGDSLKPGVKSEHIIPMTSAGTQELTSGSPTQLTSVFKFGSLAPAQDSSSVFRFNSTKANCFIFGTPTTTGDSLKPGVKSEHIIPMTSAGTQELTSGSPAQLTSVFKFGSLAPAQDSSSVFKFNSTKANCFIFGTPTTTGEPSSLYTVNITKSGFACIPQTTGSLFGTPSAMDMGTANSGFMFGTSSTAVSGTPSTSSFSSISELIPSDQKTKSVKATPCSEPGSRFGINVFSTSETDVNKIATTKVIGEGATLQNQDASKKLPFDSIQIQSNAKETPNISKTEFNERVECSKNTLAAFMASPNSWKCYTCSTSSDGTEVKCCKCGTARPADDVPDSVSSIPTAIDPKLSVGSMSSSVVSTFVPQDGKPLFSVGVASKPESLDLQPDEIPTPFPVEKFRGKKYNKKLHATHINTLSETSQKGFKFIFAPVMDFEIPQPLATLGSGFHFSLSMTPLIKTCTQSHSKLHSAMSPNNTYGTSVKSQDRSDICQTNKEYQRYDDDTGDNNDDDNNDGQQKTEYYHDDHTDNVDKGSSKTVVWPGFDKPLFGGGYVQADKFDKNDDDIQVQQGTDLHFEPIVPLLNLIEVITGEEDEIVEFCQTSKLFRFDKDFNQWKEKGVGDMKILKHKYTGVYRLLFRREKVHKLACNHLLTADIHMKPLATSEKSLCWTALDFFENETKVEHLAVKFMNVELSRRFKDKIDEIQAQLRRHN